MDKSLNQIFSSIFTIEKMESVPVCNAPQSGIIPLEINRTGEYEVQNYLDRLHISKSTEPLFTMIPKVP